MASTLPPDPYAALGVSRNADAATIKSTYRKLVLKCHPDKITGDDALKQQKQDEFVKIQQAYDIVGDEEKRAVYDAEVKLDQLRREKLARGATAPHVDVKTPAYEVRTQAPAGASASFGARGPSRYDIPKSSSRAYDDDKYYEERSRRYEYDPPPPKHTSTSRTSHKEREPVRAFTRSTTDRTRSDRRRSRDRDERRDRERSSRYASFASVEEESSSGDDKVRFEGSYRRRNEEEEARRQAADARRKADEIRRGSYEDVRRHRSSDDDDHRKQKTTNLTNTAADYIQRAKGEADTRPSPSKSSSYYSSRRTAERPEAVRRSSARPKDRPSSSGRDRDRLPDIVSWAEDERKPSFTKSASSPADIHVPSRTAPTRSYTADSFPRAETSPTPIFRRTGTEPIPSRRKDTTARASGLRNAENADSGYSSSSPPLSSYPTVPPPQTSTTRKVYHYPTPGGGVRLSPEDLGEANGHHTVYREPQPRHPASSAPLSRPPMGANRPSATSTTQRTTSANIPPPPLGRSATFNHSPTRASEDRGRSRTLFGENGRDTIRRSENMRQATAYSPERVSFAKKIGPDDIRWAPRGRDSDRDFKPSLSRHPTSVF